MSSVAAEMGRRDPRRNPPQDGERLRDRDIFIEHRKQLRRRAPKRGDGAASKERERRRRNRPRRAEAEKSFGTL